MIEDSDNADRDDAGGGAAASGRGPRIELALKTDRAGLKRLLARPPLALASGASDPPRPVADSWFDTGTRSLRAAGLTLRVRRAGGRRVQSLRLDDARHPVRSRLLRRDPLEGPALRIDALRDAGAGLSGMGERGERDLEPVFGTRVERRRLSLAVSPDRPGEAVLVTLDTGVMEAGGRRQALCELVLEAAAGRAADLYAVASVLHAIEPLVVAPGTRPRRGYALAGMAPVRWRVRAASPTPATSLGDGMAGVLEHGFEHVIGNQAAAADGGDIEGVHQMRVALRRLRAALDFFSPWLPEAQRRWFERETRWLGRRLGRARDLDVLLAETLAPVAAARPRDPALALLRRAVEKRRTRAYRRLARALASPRYTGLVLTLGRWTAARGWRGRDGAALDRALAREARPALDRAWEAARGPGALFDRLTPEERHDLRLRIKALRYATQFVGSACGDARPLLRLLARLQDGLGAAQDAAVAERLMRRCIGRAGRKTGSRLERAPAVVAGWWLAGARNRERELRRAWREFLELEPCWRRQGPHAVAPAGNARASDLV